MSDFLKILLIELLLLENYMYLKRTLSNIYSQVLIVLGCFLFLSSSCTNDVDDDRWSEVFNNTSLKSITEEIFPNLVITEGVVSQKEDTFRILRNDECIAIVKLEKPIVVSQAETSEGWGFFQFPVIYKGENQQLIVDWQMRPDSYTAYGEQSHGRMMSLDEGNTWIPLDEDLFRKERYRVELKSGDILQVKDSESRDINGYANFPKPVSDQTIKGYDFYIHSDLPKDLQGVYFSLWDKSNGQQHDIHATLEDPRLLRYSINDKMPIVWWGNIKEMADGALVAGVYPCYYQDSNGKVSRTAVSFYKSVDTGLNWKFVGTIPYQRDGASVPFDGNEGFEEPAFEVLRDGTFLCVMRTGYTSPMYMSFSYDRGVNWTDPIPFTPNGVMPNLLFLPNGALVLASGRPGLQLRFCIDGDGKVWTEPIEMLPFLNEKGDYDIWGCSCGYPSLVQIDENSFYMVYSDFKTKDKSGENRKSIMFRKVEVIKRS